MIISVHSQGALYTKKIMQKYPDFVKAVVFVEAATLPALDEDLTAFSKIPQLYVYGDFMSEDYKVVHSWADSIRKTAPAWYAKLNELHADHTWMNLPAMGIKGNSHMLMMDDNNDQIADMINDWLVKKVPCGSK